MSAAKTPSKSLEQQVFDRIEWCYRQAEAGLGRAFPRPEVTLDLQGQIAGSATLEHNRLRFHPGLLATHQAHYIEHVVAHEVAHLVVWHQFGRTRPHGREWKAVMENLFGVPADRTHRYPVSPSRQLRRFTYYCGCREHELTSIRHNRIQKGLEYRCTQCGERLTEASS